jgi:DeoR family transcriptional regulator of aga operon
MSESRNTSTPNLNESIENKEDNKRIKAPLMLHRRARIADLVRQRGVMRVDELADLFQVSEVTIRHDLAQLEKEGQLIRDRGGAIPIKQVSTLPSIAHRAELNLEEKRRIGCAAAQLVNPGDTIIMDGGTTVVKMTRHLANISALTVVTNGLDIATELGAVTDAQVILLGGMLHREASSTLGPLTEQSLNDLVVQKLFLGAQAVDLKVGLTDSSIEIAQVKRAMIRAARQVILLVDASKWGRTGFYKIAPLSAVHTIITDTNLPDAARTAIERLGIDLLLV